MLRYLALVLLFGAFSDLSASWLRAKENKIVNEEGHTVILRGINLGGWLVQEMWMMPFVTTPPANSQFKAITDYITLWGTLEARFGKEKVLIMKHQARKMWFQANDLDRIKELGFNTVRVPFLADIDEEPQGLFLWLDWVIEEAKKRDIYVILDLHGAYGRQSKEQHTGEQDVDQFFSHESDITKTKKLWKKIAERYKNTSTVAGYDLLNEPMGAKNTEELFDVYEKLYHEIREVDTKHIIFVEDGYKGIDNLHPKSYASLDNIVLSIHVYDPNAQSEGDYVPHLKHTLELFSDFQKECNIPFYLGEFNVNPHGTADTIKKYIKLLESESMSWSPWTYKVANGWLNDSLWGIYTLKENLKMIDPFQDSEEAIMKKLKQLDTANFSRNESLAKVFRKE